MDLVWETPPEEVLNKPRSGPYTEVIEALKANPEKWARIPREYKTADSAANAAANMRRGIGAFTPKGSFEAVTKDRVVWARYVGKNDASGQPDEEPHTDAADSEATGPLAPKIREWARGKGLEVPDRGRLPRDIIDGYFDDTGEERPPHLRVV